MEEGDGFQVFFVRSAKGQLPGRPPIIQMGANMPTVKDISGPYRFFFYSFDCDEQIHVHVQRGRMICKFWMRPVVLTKNNGFAPKELNRIRQIILNNSQKIMEAWYEHCGEKTGSED